MRRYELDKILATMLASTEGISDLNFSVGRPLQVEAYGKLKKVDMPPLRGNLTSVQMEKLMMAIVGENERLLSDLIQKGSCDCSYSLPDETRFRVNIFRQRGNYAMVLRKLQSKIPSISDLGLPPIFNKMTDTKTGLILLTGATGSGKTTTLAAILNEINAKNEFHIITLEDPIEFVHPHKMGTFNQRELGQDFDTFPNGLRAALRQAPKVILVGEMRDRETVEIALSAAETGHLVMSTLHTIDAGQTINRIVGMFEQSEEVQIRARLAETLRFVVSQRLAPKVGGGRVLLAEIMGENLRTKECIIYGESDVRSYYEIIEASSSFGWSSFDQWILNRYEEGVITEETAILYASKKNRVTRTIDGYKATKLAALPSGLSMKKESQH